jgi:hypothetical protein
MAHYRHHLFPHVSDDDSEPSEIPDVSEPESEPTEILDDQATDDDMEVIHSLDKVCFFRYSGEQDIHRGSTAAGYIGRATTSLSLSHPSTTAGGAFP